MGNVSRNLVSGVLFLAAAGGAVALVSWDRRSRAAKGESERKEKQAFDLQADEIDQLELTHAGVRVVARKEGADWRISSPVETPGDAAAWQSVASSVASLELNARFKPSELDPATVGLALPETTVLARTAGGRTAEVWVGKKSTFDDSLYVRAGDKAVEADLGTTASYNVTAFQKSLVDLREKRLLVAGSTDVETIVVTRRAGHPTATGFKARRAPAGDTPTWDDPWDLLEPVSARADRDEVSRMVGALTNLRATTFVDELGTDLERWGLAPPYVTITVVAKGKETTILVGKVVEGTSTRFYAKRADQPQVAEVSEASGTAVDKDLHALRDKRVADFDRDKVRTIEATWPGGGRLVLSKSAADGSWDTWRVTAPRDAPARSWKVSSLLYNLSNLKAARFVREGMPPETPAEVLDAHGFRDPARVVALKDEAGAEVATFLVGKTEGSEVFVMRRGGPTVGAVEKKRVDDDLPSAVEDFVDEPPPPGSDAGAGAEDLEE